MTTPRRYLLAALLVVGGGLCLAGCHQIHQARAEKLANSALDHFDRAEYDRALDHSEIALRLGAQYPELFQIRASIFLRRGDAGAAITEADAALALVTTLNTDPKNPRAPVEDSLVAMIHFVRGNALQGLGRLAEARTAFETAVSLHPDYFPAQNNLAWLLATAPDDAVRDAEAAITHARAAADLTRHQDAGIIDTLAAAHAESGDFKEAVKWQREAIALIGKNELFVDTSGFAERLADYEAGKPHREDPQAAYETGLETP